MADFHDEMLAIANGYIAHLKDALDLPVAGNADANDVQRKVLRDLNAFRTQEFPPLCSQPKGRDRDKIALARTHQLWGILQEAEADFNALLSTGDLIGKARRFSDLAARYSEVRRLP
ncbi:hypothetical protein [Thalassococcus lentus]|uniref:Uncharacterized protein n=1 Tax=Thalassococcus lentus TaxID=1210524 RepID=A0ABT4XUN8_9RHOB|nr:hypothetical protein [Thalassococcus lentus]MDA7425641.1 hypothetical protein [Thalassococcus lentus]